MFFVIFFRRNFPEMLAQLLAYKPLFQQSGAPAIAIHERMDVDKY